MKAALEEEPKAAEDRLLELKREVEDMLEAEQGPGLPGWGQDSLPESVTQEQAYRLHSLWLDVQIRRHQQRPDLYDSVRTHDGKSVMRMLAYCADKKARLRDILEETGELRDRRPSPSVAKVAAEIASGCESLEEIFSMTGDHYGRTLFPHQEKRGLR